MTKYEYVEVEVVISELTNAGHMVIEAARRRSGWRKSLLVPTNGKIEINIWEDGDEPSDDVLAVRVVSKLTWRERSLRYGIAGLNKSEISHMGRYGFPIPTEEYLDQMEEAWDDGSLARPMTQLLFITRKSAEAYIQGKMTGAEVINQFGEEIQQFCEEGQFTLA
jgi:hypothetical protein